MQTLKFEETKPDKANCATGSATDVLANLQNIQLPRTPPIRGKSRIKQKGSGQNENIFQAAKLARERRNRMKTGTHAKSMSATEEAIIIQQVTDGRMLTDDHVYMQHRYY